MQALKKYLTLNAIFSDISGLGMILFSSRLNKLFALENVYIFPVIGVNLLIFGAIVWFVSVKQLSNKALVTTITVLDLLWVLGSVLIVLFAPFGISNIGNILISVVAVWIAFLAYKQYINLGNEQGN